MLQTIIKQCQNDPYDYQLTLDDVEMMKRYLPKINHHVATKMFAALTEIPGEKRREIWKEYVTKKPAGLTLELDFEPEPWEPIKLENFFEDDEPEQKNTITSLFTDTMHAQVKASACCV